MNCIVLWPDTYIRTLCVGVRPPLDSTDGDIQTFVIYISETTGSTFYIS